MARIWTIGEFLAEIMREDRNIPLDGPGVFLGPYPSGAPAIFISVVAQLGHQAKMWGGVGDDKFGTVILRRLMNDGVDCSDIVVDPHRITGTAFIAYDSSGDREYIFHVGQSAAASLQYTPSVDQIPDYFHIMGCSLMAAEEIESAINTAVTFYAAYDVHISFDPNIRTDMLHGRSREDITATVMKHCTIFMPGEKELKQFSDKPTERERIEDLFERYKQISIINVKHGSRGSVVYTRTQEVSVPTYPIEEVYPIVDPTGAGDSYDAAFVCGLAEGLSLQEATEMATKAGALNTIAFGPMSGDMSILKKPILQSEQHTSKVLS